MKVAVYPESPASQALAQTWANQFNLPLVFDPDLADWLLCVGQEHVSFSSVKNPLGLKPIWIDFLQGKLSLRSQEHSARGELIAKAVGVKRNSKLQVLDVTAGWGRDAFILATLGCQVTMVERSPVIAMLLQDALNRLFVQQNKITAQQFILVHQQAHSFLQALHSLPDVIYMDPMYPHRVKSALVKKEMRILREVVGEDDDFLSLFLLALEKTKRRVVVKRPLHSDFLANKKPDCQFVGRSTRFDVYIQHAN